MPALTSRPTVASAAASPEWVTTSSPLPGGDQKRVRYNAALARAADRASYPLQVQISLSEPSEPSTDGGSSDQAALADDFEARLGELPSDVAVLAAVVTDAPSVVFFVYTADPDWPSASADWLQTAAHGHHVTISARRDARWRGYRQLVAKPSGGKRPAANAGGKRPAANASPAANADGKRPAANADAGDSPRPIAPAEAPANTGLPRPRRRAARLAAIWRPIVLLALTVVAVIVGLGWKKDGNPPTDSLRREQIIQVFVSDPRASVQLTAAFASSRGGRMLEDLYLSVVPPTNSEDVEWALVSLDRSIQCNFPSLRSSSLVFGAEPHAAPLRAWLCMGDTNSSSLSSLATLQQEQLPGIGQLQTADPLAAATTNGSFVASSPLPAIDEISSGVMYARVPALDLEALPGPGVALIAGVKHDQGQFSYLLDEVPRPLLPSDAGSDNISSYEQPPDMLAMFKTPFFVPTSIRTQALLELTSTQSRLVSYRIDQVDPSDGSFVNGNFLWTGTGYIEPTVQLSDPNTDQQRSEDDLLAGVALGVAASAFIALVQVDYRRFRRRRTVLTGGQGDGGPDQAQQQATQPTA